MKITLGELALLPVSFLAGTLLIWLTIACLVPQNVVHHWDIALSNVGALRLYFKSHPSIVYVPADIDTVNQYLSHSLEKPPRLSELKWIDNKFDPWGNPYVCVERPEDSDEGDRPWHFYSTGQDGKSATNGNDPDDIGSWKEMQVVANYYHAETRKRKRTAAVLLGLVSSPFVFLALVFMKRLYFGHPFRHDH